MQIHKNIALNETAYVRELFVRFREHVRKVREHVYQCEVCSSRISFVNMNKKGVRELYEHEIREQSRFESHLCA